MFILNVERDSNTNEQIDLDEIGNLSPNTKLERTMSQPLMIIPSPINRGTKNALAIYVIILSLVVFVLGQITM